jgi:two-component system capsular synthesis response regulator RcsB
MTTFSMRVAIADDHPFVLLGTQHTLTLHNSIKVVGAVSNSTELVALLKSAPCDVLITDYAMPGGAYGDGSVLLSYLHNHFPNLKIVVMTMVNNPAILQQISESGVRCILNKADDSSHLIPALHVAFSGGRYFSPSFATIMQSLHMDKLSGSPAKELSKRELEVMRQYAAGNSIGEIAGILNRSKQTISTQKTNAMKKLGITRDVDLYKYLIDGGF